MTDSTTATDSIRDKFTESEWKTLAGTPMLVVAGMSMADKTGPRAMMTEMSAGANAYMAGAKHFTDSPLIGALASSVNQGMFEDISPSKDKSPEVAGAEMQARAIEGLNAGTKLIEDKASAADLDAYKKWVIAIATYVMTAAKSNTKLGLGGEQVSSGEKAFFEQLKTTLGVTDEEVEVAPEQ